MYNNLRTNIKSVIKTNTNKDITGDKLQNALIQIIDNLDLGGLFLGFANTLTTPNYQANGFYFSNGSGTYSNFIGLNGNPLIIGDGLEVIYRTKIDDSWFWKNSTVEGLISSITNNEIDNLLVG